MSIKLLGAEKKKELLQKGWNPDEIRQLEIQMDPALWAEIHLKRPDDPSKPLKLRHYQKNILRSDSRKKVLRCGRRVGKSIVLCIEMLWIGFNNSNRSILACAPYKSQISQLWKDGFHKLIKGNTFIENSITKMGQNPWTIEFANGSRILGLTAGSKTGNKGTAIRGQNSTDLYLDEVDYMGDEAIQSIMAIIATRRDTRFVVSSTPTGKREFFYLCCMNKSLGYDEFHYPSSASPEWLSIEDAKKKNIPLHESQEYIFRNMNPEYVYEKEYCFVGTQKVLTSDNLKEFKDLKIGDKVNCDGKYVNISNFKHTGLKECKEVITDVGSIKCTVDHKFNTPDGKVSLDKTTKLNIQPNKRLNYTTEEKLGAVIGFLLGDGTINKSTQRVSFYSQYLCDIERIRSYIKDSIPNNYIGRINKKDINLYSIDYGQSVKDYLISIGCPVGNRVNQSYSIPNIIKNGSLKIKRAFLSALFSTDGSSIRPTKGLLTLSFNKNNKEHGIKYANEIVNLINSIGFTSVWTNTNTTYCIYIRGDNWVDFAIKFYEEIGYNTCYKKELNALCSYLYAKKYKRLIRDKKRIWNYLKYLRLNKKLSYIQIEKLGFSKKVVIKAKNDYIPKRLYGEIETYKEFKLYNLNPRGVYCEILKKISIGNHNVYNITVDSFDHSYTLDNGILTYNCAKFGSEVEGVFKHNLIDSSLYLFSNEHADPKGRYWHCGDDQNKKNVYIMGVDWNGEKNGTQIIILEYMKDPTDIEYIEEGEDKNGQIKKSKIKETFQNKYRVFYRESVSIHEMTQVRSIERIISLNKKFKIDHIYVDAGYGHSNIEELKLYGKRHMESNINSKIVSVDFQSKVMVYDPITKEQVKKPTKPFMVFNAQNCLERDEFILPESEDEKVRLVGQMREYRIEKITQYGVPKFSEENDHILDAFMLAVFGFQMEYNELIQEKFSTTIGKLSKPLGLVSGLNEVSDRTIKNDKDDVLGKYGVEKRQPKLNADKYHSDSRGSYMDYEDLVKDKNNNNTSPFQKSIRKTGWNKIGSPKRSIF